MSNNVIVDVNHINNAIAKVDRLWTEASHIKYSVTPIISGRAVEFAAAPFQVHRGYHDLKIEATAISSGNVASRWRWGPWGGNKIYCNYTFKTNFSQSPIITATYDGNVDGVTVRVDVHSRGSGTDFATVYLTKTAGKNQKWIHSKDVFYVHLIAIGI